MDVLIAEYLVSTTRWDPLVEVLIAEYIVSTTRWGSLVEVLIAEYLVQAHFTEYIVHIQNPPYHQNMNTNIIDSFLIEYLSNKHV